MVSGNSISSQWIISLVRNVVQQVRLRHVHLLRDLVDGGTAKAVAGKDVERGLGDLLFLLFLDTCSPLRLGRPGVRSSQLFLTDPLASHIPCGLFLWFIASA